MRFLRSDAQVEAPYAAFVRAASPRLLHAAELLTGNQHDAEDCVQAVLMRMYLRWDKIDQGDPVGYARRALVNEVTDRWRRRRHREALQEPPERGVADAGFDGVGARDAALGLLAGLTARERAVVVLRYYEDLSEAQTAAALGIAPGTVKSTANRALGRLRAAADPTSTATARDA